MWQCISSARDVNSESRHLIVFSSREILQLISFGELLFHSAWPWRVIKLRISRRFLLRDRFASFISLCPALHLFTIRARYGRRKRVICYNVFSLFGRPGRSRLPAGNVSWNRTMPETCYAYTQAERENRDGALHRVESVKSPDLLCFYLCRD